MATLSSAPAAPSANLVRASQRLSQYRAIAVRYRCARLMLRKQIDITCGGAATRHVRKGGAAGGRRRNEDTSRFKDSSTQRSAAICHRGTPPCGWPKATNNAGGIGPMLPRRGAYHCESTLPRSESGWWSVWLTTGMASMSSRLVREVSRSWIARESPPSLRHGRARLQFVVGGELPRPH